MGRQRSRDRGGREIYQDLAHARRSKTTLPGGSPTHMASPHEQAGAELPAEPAQSATVTVARAASRRPSRRPVSAPTRAEWTTKTSKRNRRLQRATCGPLGISTEITSRPPTEDLHEGQGRDPQDARGARTPPSPRHTQSDHSTGFRPKPARVFLIAETSDPDYKCSSLYGGPDNRLGKGREYG